MAVGLHTQETQVHLMRLLKTQQFLLHLSLENVKTTFRRDIGHMLLNHFVHLVHEVTAAQFWASATQQYLLLLKESGILNDKKLCYEIQKEFQATVEEFEASNSYPSGIEFYKSYLDCTSLSMPQDTYERHCKKLFGGQTEDLIAQTEGIRDHLEIFRVENPDYSNIPAQPAHSTDHDRFGLSRFIHQVLAEGRQFDKEHKTIIQRLYPKSQE